MPVGEEIFRLAQTPVAKVFMDPRLSQSGFMGVLGRHDNAKEE